MSIKILDPEICNLIAAGEVVQRPASVVKELVENSIDAGATKIKVEISNAGVSQIRVSDNGIGMSPEDARTAFLKHATSKISTKDDLFSISTLGFRGEALASIAAVSHTELLTKQRDAVSGTRIVINGGEIVSEEEAACADGSVFTVRDLFYNTPARLKFLKSERTETGIITDYFQKLALSRPDISFSLYVSGRQTLFTVGNGSLKDIIHSIYGREYAQTALRTDYEAMGIKVSGYTGSPLYSKSGRGWEHFFLNGRYIKSTLLQNVLESTYKNSMLISRYPVCVLFIQMDPSLVDVNVHPNKLSAKFSDEQSVARVLSEALDRAIKQDTGLVEMNIEPAEKIKQPQTEPSPIRPQQELPKIPTSIKEYNGWTVYDYSPIPGDFNIAAKSNIASGAQIIRPLSDIAIHKTEIPQAPVDAGVVYKTFSKAAQSCRQQSVSSTDSRPQPESVTPITDPVLIDEIFPKTPAAEGQEAEIRLQGIGNNEDFRIIGEAFSTFIIVQQGQELLFIDKHALHERMLFEKLRKRQIQTQTLLVPYIISFTGGEESVLIENAEKLKELGFDVSDFGDGSIAVREIPQIVDIDDVEPILSKYASIAGFKDNDGVTDEFLHTVACKAAIKSGMNTTDEEMKALVEAYLNNPHELRYCPHGRPVTFTLSKQSIEKQFKRIL